MAAASPSIATETSTDSKLDLWKDALYEQCQRNGDTTRLYTQADLLDFGVIPNSDPATLVRAVQSLCDDKLLVPVTSPGGVLSWRWRELSEAEKYKLCTTEEQKMVFAAIDEAGGDGIWTQTLLKRLNMHDKVLRTALKQLVAKDLVRPFNSVEHPNKKMYIKASIQPSERATGGPWFTDATLDEPFIEDLRRILYRQIRRGSACAPRRDGPQRPKKGVLRGVDKGKKRSADLISDEHPHGANGPAAASSSSNSLSNAARKESAFLPYPAGYTAYPTVHQLARFIHDHGIVQTTVLREAEIQDLVNVLVWDGLVEPVKIAGRIGYRVTRYPHIKPDGWAAPSADGDAEAVESALGPEPRVNGLTEAPCGKCPVFDLCEEGGPVSASNCVYFKKWLGLDLD